jgi:hypothetical protein
MGVTEEPVMRKRRYLSYLLRLWQESGGGELPGDDAPLWRASLESPQSDERLGFASLRELYAFLEEEMGSSSAGMGPVDEDGCRLPARDE